MREEKSAEILEMENIHVDHSYTADDIQVLEGLEAVRKRPGMYIGTTGARGLHHLVWEIVDNGIDEALAGYADEIDVVIEKDNVVCVSDNGRGMPVGIHEKTGISAVETIMTVLHAGGKFGGGAYKVSGGLHGVGASVVNALSEWLEVTVHQDGKRYFIRFEQGGHPSAPLKEIGTSDRHGTVVRFKADPLIFTETTEYDFETLNTRIRQLAFLNRNIRLNLRDERGDKPVSRSYCYEGGIIEYVRYLNQNKTVLHDEVVYVEGLQQGILAEIAMQYNDGYMPNIYSFCNNINTQEGGTHEDGFRLALTRVLNNYAKNNNMLKKEEKARYKYQLELLQNSLMGQKAMNFEMKLVDGSKLKLWDIDAKMIFLFFNDDECGDCSIARLRLSTDVNLNKMIDSGEVVFVCVYMEKYSDEWAQKARTDSDKWIIGANNEVADKYDLRIQPSVYILDANKVILDKNISADGIKQLLN